MGDSSMKRLVVLIFAFIIIFAFTSCTQEDDGSVNFGDYVLPEDQSTTEYESEKYDSQELVLSDSSWLDSYALEYSYFDTKTGESKIAEGRCGNYYQSIDYATDTITFYSQEDGYILEYMLNTQTKTGTAAVVTGATMENLYSGFSMISTCDPYFPVYKNVTKVGQDFVADRSTTRYKQTQTENGVVTKIAYVWIDDELGFASKCEQYNAQTEELEMRWELLSFTRNVTQDDIKVDIDSYTLTTEN